MRNVIISPDTTGTESEDAFLLMVIQQYRILQLKIFIMIVLMTKDMHLDINPMQVLQLEVLMFLIQLY